MSFSQRLRPYSWVLALLGSLSLVLWLTRARVRDLQYATAQASWSVAAPAVDRLSPTGYAGAVRQLLVPEQNSESQEWVMQTQQLLHGPDWRVRHVDYDNAPYGRDTALPSLYRGWLGLLAWLDQRLTGIPAGLAVERAALYADPLLFALALIGTTWFVWRRLGGLAAALFAAGAVTLFPLGGQFLPGLPDHRGLATLCLAWSVLPLVAGTIARNAASETSRIGSGGGRWFLIAGVAGGLGLWVDPSGQIPVLVGIGAGALLAGGLARRGGGATELPAGPAQPWLIWALAGGATVLGACGLDYCPGSGRLPLETVHPLHGLGWIAAGLVVDRAVAWMQAGEIRWRSRDWIPALVAVLALGAIAWLCVTSRAFAAGPFATRLTNLPNDGTVASSLGRWIARDGASPAVVATLLPFGLAVPVGFLLFQRKVRGLARTALVVALAPLAVAVGLACFRMQGWSGCDGLLLVLLVGAVSVHCTISPRGAGWLWPAAVALLFAPGLARLLPPPAEAVAGLSGADLKSLIDRDLAQWLTKRAGDKEAIVLASPALTSALCYYGHLRGLGTMAPENTDGVPASVRIASATSMTEASALIQQRQVTYIVIPSWDSFLDLYARMGSTRLDRVFVASLRAWNLPGWLRPVAYSLPRANGIEDQSVLVFEVVEEQGDVVAKSNLAEYFVETGQLRAAAEVEKSLRRFPADLGALAARAQVEIAQGDLAAFDDAVNRMPARLAAGADRALPWARRVSLAVVLARGKQVALARGEVRRCVETIDADKVRSLTTGSLYRLQVLTKAFGLTIENPAVRQLALDLLPPDLRLRL